MTRPQQAPLKPIAVIAGMAGNMMEWYDFALYGVMAPTLGKVFFPQSNRLVAIISVFGVFAAGYIMRLGGGAFFGHLADHYGRRFALLASAIVMAITTALVGFLPSYAAIGIAAPLLLVTLRLIQGLSTGGEFITSITYLVENAPSKHRGLIGTLAGSTASGGILLGSATGTILFSIFSAHQIFDWAWRIPFLISIPLGLSIAVLRTSLPEEGKPSLHTGTRHRRSSSSRPLRAPLGSHPWRFWGMGIPGRILLDGYFHLLLSLRGKSLQ